MLYRVKINNHGSVSSKKSWYNALETLICQAQTRYNGLDAFYCSSSFSILLSAFVKEGNNDKLQAKVASRFDEMIAKVHPLGKLGGVRPNN